MANKPKGYIQEVLTGFFVLAVIVLLAFFTIIISGVDLIYGRQSRAYTVSFDNVGALKVQDPVLVRGMKVGSVQNMVLGEDAVLVTFRLQSQVELKEDYVITVSQTTLLGGSCLEVSTGRAENTIAEDKLLIGSRPANLVADLGELVSDLRGSFDGDDLRVTLQNARAASQDIALISSRITKGEGIVGELLAKDSALAEELRSTVANVRQTTENIRDGKGLVGKLINEGDETYRQLQAIVADVHGITADIRAGKGLIGHALKEGDPLHEDLQATVANIRAITARLNDPNSELGRVIAGDTTLIRDLEATAKNLNTITGKISTGEGTIGRLVCDDGIAVELEAAIKDVRQIIDNMRDTAPITTFTSIFFGGF